MLWIKLVEMVDSLDELKSSRSVSGKNFPNFEMLDARIASALNKIILSSHFKKQKVSLEEQTAQKEDRFQRGRQIAFMINDWWSWYRVGLCWFILCLLFMTVIFRKSTQDGGRSSVVYVKNSIQWYLGKSVQIEKMWVSATRNRIGIVRHGDSSKDIGSQLSKVENIGEESFRSETSITKVWRKAWENLIRSSGQESKGIHRRSRRKKVYATSGKKKASVRMELQKRAVRRAKEETSAVLLQSGFFFQKVVVGFCGMLLPSARCPKPFGRRENSVWTKIWRILLGHACSRGEFGKKIFWLLRLKNWKSRMHQKYIPEDWMRKKSW